MSEWLTRAVGWLDKAASLKELDKVYERGKEYVIEHGSPGEDMEFWRQYNLRIGRFAEPERRNPVDTMKQEMVDHLKETFGDEADDFDIEAAIYWYASDYYSGQGDPLYSILSMSKFEPGPTHRSVDDEGEMAAMMYESLEERFGQRKENVGEMEDNPEGSKRKHRGPGKFDYDLDEVLYSFVLDGMDDEDISEEGFGAYSLLTNLTRDEVTERAKELKLDISDEELDDADGASAILFERSDGIVEVDLYDSEEDARKDWAKIQKAYDEFMEEVEGEEAETE